MTDEGTPDRTTAERPVIKRSSEVDANPVPEAKGVEKAVVFDESDGAPNFRMRWYSLEPGAEVPRHTNEVEHEMHTVAGEFVAGLGDGEHRVTQGDSLLIPPGTVHWFRNEGDEVSEFICVVPNGDPGLRLADESQ